MCLCFLWWSHPAHFVLLFFLFFVFFYFLVVLTCITVQLDLLLQWHGHRMSYLCKNGKLTCTKILEGQKWTAYLEFENVWCLKTHWTSAVFCVTSCVFKSVKNIYQTWIINKNKFSHCFTEYWLLAGIWHMYQMRWKIADATVSSKLTLSGAFFFFF